MAARMVNATPTANANLAGFGFGAMFPSWLTLPVPVPVLIPVSSWTLRGADRKRCVSYFTLRTIISLMETIKDFYIPGIPWDGTLGRGAAIALPSAGVALAKRSTHGIDRNPRYDTRYEEPTDTNPDRKCTPKRLPRHDIAITDCEASNEGEVDRITHGPALQEAN